MKLAKKILSFGLFFGFVFSMLFANPMVAKAATEYTYTIKIILGCSGDEGAYFNDKLGIKVPEGATVEFIDSEKTGIKISGLKYNDQVTIDPATMVKISPQEKLDEDGNKVEYQKYYVKGVRFAGRNRVYSGAYTFDVTYDETFVLAYGVGEVVPYIVNYVDKDGNAIDDPEHPGQKIKSVTAYAPAGEDLYVSYRYIPGYKPNTYAYHTKSLKAPTVDDEGVEHPFEFTFKYSTNGSSPVVEDTVEVTETSTVLGDSEYTYETVSRNTERRTAGTTNNRGGNGGNAAGGDADNADADANADAAGDNTTIADEETPQDVIEIEDEDTARAGGAKDRFVRNMIIGIIIAVVAVIAILVTLYVADKKRKKQLATVEKPHTEDKE